MTTSLQEAVSPFGFPIVVDEDGIAEIGLLGRHVPRATGGTLALVRQKALRDIALGKASGRWRIGQPDPVALVPGDVPMLRALAVSNRLRMLTETLGLLERAERLPVVNLEHQENFRASRHMLDIWVNDALRLQEAVPFFVPAGTAVALMESEAPDVEVFAHLRLPFPAVLVIFSAELMFSSADLLTKEAGLVMPDRVTELVGRGTSNTLLNEIVQRGGAVTGAVFFSGPDGIGLADEVLWVLSGEPEASNPLDRPRDFFAGSLITATLAPAIANLAAAVAWASWIEPDAGLDLPDDPQSREWNRAINRGQFRRAEPRGAAAGVHILDLKRTTQNTSTSDEPSSGTAKLTGHLRRGHWKRVRVGPRDGWHYEGRWIAPVIVNPDNFDSEALRIYRMPV